MNVVQFPVKTIEGLAYERVLALKNAHAESFNAWLRDNECAMQCLLKMAELQALDELRLEIAGYTPQPMQAVLKNACIMNSDAIEVFKSLHRQEAKH